MQVRCPGEPGSEIRPLYCHWGRRKRGVRAPCLGPGRTHLPADKRPSSRLAKPHCTRPAAAPLLPPSYPSPGSPLSLPLLSSHLLRPPRRRGGSGARLGSRSGLPRAWRSVREKGFRPQGGSPPTHPYPTPRTPPPREPEPSGRDLGGGWEGTAPGKEEGAIPG